MVIKRLEKIKRKRKVKFKKRLENIKIEKRKIHKKIEKNKDRKKDVHKMIEKHKVRDDENRRKTLKRTRRKKRIRVRGTRLIDRITFVRNSGVVCHNNKEITF
jgi:hypothetical protein